MKRKIFSIILSIILILAIKNYSNASGAAIQCSDTGSIGKPINITVTGTGCQWKLDLKVNGTKVATNSQLDSIENQSISFSGSYTPKAEGNLNITLEGSVTGDDNVTVRNFGSKTIKISATSSNNNSGTSTSSNTSSSSNKNTSTKSNNAKLKNLGIKPNDFSGFSPSKYAYSTTVPNDVEKVEVYAQEGESGQKVTGTGYKTLKEGSNSFEVVVTAADGKTTQKYTINITRESKDSDKEEKEEKKEEEKTEETKEDSKETTFGLKKLQIAGFDSKIKFDPDVHEYKIDVNEDIDKLDLSVLATDENALIEISGNEDFQEGENVVTILVKDKDGEESVVYQIIVNKSLAQPEQENVVMDLIKDNIPLVIVAGAFVFVLFILIIVVIVKKAKKDDYEDDEYDEEDEDEYYGNENYNSNSLIDSKEDKTSYEDFYNKYDNKEQDDVYVEKPKRKRHAKGKRFK